MPSAGPKVRLAVGNRQDKPTLPDFDRLALTQQLLQNATQAMTLAQARLSNGLGSIIELSQAELNQSSAQIGVADARYDYQIQHAALEFQLGRLR